MFDQILIKFLGGVGAGAGAPPQVAGGGFTSQINKNKVLFRFPAMRRCPRGGFRGVESDFEVQNGLQQAPGMKMNEFMRFINLQNFNKKSINPFSIFFLLFFFVVFLSFCCCPVCFLFL